VTSNGRVHQSQLNTPSLGTRIWFKLSNVNELHCHRIDYYFRYRTLGPCQLWPVYVLPLAVNVLIACLFSTADSSHVRVKGYGHKLCAANGYATNDIMSNKGDENKVVPMVKQA